MTNDPERPEEGLKTMMTTLHATTAHFEGDESARRAQQAYEDYFGDAAECTADAQFVKRLALIVVPAILMLCLLSLALAQLTA